MQNPRFPFVHFLLGLFIGASLVLGFLLYLTPEKETIGVHPENETSPRKAIGIFVDHLDSAGLSSDFPCKGFVEAFKFPYPEDISQLFDTLNIIKPKDTLNNIILVHKLLTDSTFAVTSQDWAKYNADASWEAIHWVDMLRSAENATCMDPKTLLLFQALRLSWMDFIANHLTISAKRDWRLKQQASFMLLNLECQKRNYNLSLGYSKIDKGVIRLSNNEFAYIWKRIHSDLGILIILVLIFSIPVFIYGIYRIVTYHWPKRIK
jgi:hypothetical protein